MAIRTTRPFRRTNLIILYVSLTLCGNARSRRAPVHTCWSERCQALAGVYDRTVDESVDPCEDFFSYVCSGWLKNVARVHAHSSRLADFGTRNLGEFASREIVQKELDRLTRVLKNATADRIRNSETQAAHLYRSCLDSIDGEDWELNVRTLRTFFNEVGLPFFGGERTVEMISGQASTVLSTLLMLALQFGMEPIFTIDFRPGYLWLQRRGALSSGPPSDESPTEIAAKWKAQLLEQSRNDSLDAVILSAHASVLAAHHIRLEKTAILRIGRNYEAVGWMYWNSFHQSVNEVVNFTLDAHSEILNTSYAELFGRCAGNLAKFKEYTVMKWAPHFSLPFFKVATDPQLYQIFDDFIGFWLLMNDFSVLSNEASCGVSRAGTYCGALGRSKRARLCTMMVSTHTLRGGAIQLFES